MAAAELLKQKANGRRTMYKMRGEKEPEHHQSGMNFLGP